MRESTYGRMWLYIASFLNVLLNLVTLWVYNSPWNLSELSSVTLKNHQREDVEDLRIERGQVVVFNKQRGQHSSVCDDQDWGIQEAKVVCRALYSNDPDYV